MKKQFSLKIIFLFACSSVAGYIWEVVLTYARTGILCNRGFMHGPWLPIYGVGALFLLFLLYRFADHPIIVFFLSGIIGSFVELITGLALDIYWNVRYWDYSGLKLDLAGYVSFISFLGFCLAGTLWVCILVPLLYKVWKYIPALARCASALLFCTIFFIDYVYSLFCPNSGTGITF
ncbi:MAG: putative ABC transporter permease [Lachnospiraceae bacterium]|nr:putative ABC transporter permease [Lachnospiraceae bacterium]